MQPETHLLHLHLHLFSPLLPPSSLFPSPSPSSFPSSPLTCFSRATLSRDENTLVSALILHGAICCVSNGIAGERGTENCYYMYMSSSGHNGIASVA